MRRALIVLVLISTSCKKSHEVDCGAAAKGWAELVTRQQEGDDDERRAKATAAIPALREALVKQCKEAGWSLAVRRCVAAARSSDDLDRCDPGTAATPTPESPTPAPTAAAPAASPATSPPATPSQPAPAP